MKTTPAFRMAIAVTLTLTIFTLQWKVNSQLRNELQLCKREMAHTEDLRGQLRGTLAVADSREKEILTLQTEITKLKNDVRLIEGEGGGAHSMANSALRPNDGGATSQLSGKSSSQHKYNHPITPEPSVSKLLPGVRTNLAPLPDIEGGYYCFRSGGEIDGIHLWNGMPEKTVKEGPDWNVSLPLPISFAEGEALARSELGNLVQEQNEWELVDIGLHRLSALPPEPQSKWHYSFKFNSKDHKSCDSVTVHLSFGGTLGITGLRPD